jgi:pyruvate/2-oxoglutarate/acetoin dehydrogenase E1 component
MGLLKSAIRDDNPVIFLEHKRLYTLKGEVDHEPVPLSVAKVVRAGADVTIVTALKHVHDALHAAEQLAAQGIDAEVIDLRTLRPLDIDSVVRSAAKTRCLVVVEEGPRTGGWSAEVLAIGAEHLVGSLKAAWRITGPDLPLPYSPLQEDRALITADRIAEEVVRHLDATASGRVVGVAP